MTRKGNRNKKSRRTVGQHLRHVAVPHRGNQYRPHAIRWRGVAIVLALVVLAQVVYGVLTPGGVVLGRVSDISIQTLVDDTNTARATEDLTALTQSELLTQAAELKAEDMFAHDYWAHTSPTGVTPWKWFGDVGYEYAEAGENLAKNYPDASKTVEAWMNSPTHRENIMNSNFTEVGFAVREGMLEGEQTVLVVAMYGLPASQVASVVGASVFAAPVGTATVNPWNYFATAFMSASPATHFSLILLAAIALVALVAHFTRKKLPPEWRSNWRAHHGMFTFVGMVGLGVMLVLATGGGQL